MPFQRRLIRILRRCLSTAPPRRSPATFTSEHIRLPNDLVVNFLKRHSILHRVADQKANLRVCPFCPPHKDSADNLYKIYIWLSNGRCFCHRCGANCSWYDYQTQIGAIPSVSNVAGERIGALPSVPDSGEQTDTTVPAPVVALDQNKAAESRAKLDTDTVALDFLKKRGFSLEVIKKYGVGAADIAFLQPSGNWEKETCVTFPWARMEEDTGNGPIYVDRMKIRSVTAKRNQRLFPAGGGWGLFGWHTIPMSADDLIVVTEGEFDAMAVHQATGLLAVSLPNGAASLPIEVIPCLERFKRIVLWMDDDTAGQDGAEKFVRKLGLGRCRIVRSKCGKADGPKDANDALLQGADLGELISQARPPAHKRILHVADLRSDIVNEIQNGAQFVGTKIVTLPSLHNLLKGHRKGELTVFTGQTGLGKTTVLSQLSLDLCAQGVSTLWGSFEIKNQRLAQTMLRQLEGKSLEGCNEAELNDMLDRMAKFPLFFLSFFGASDVNQVIDAMQFAVYVHDVDHILLDNLQFMLGTADVGGSKFEKQDQAISMFRQFATDNNVHITLVIHPRKESSDQPLSVSSVFGSARATQEADNVLILNPSPFSTDIRYLVVGKNRFDGETGSVPYRFDKESRRIVELDRFEREQVRMMQQSLKLGQEIVPFKPSTVQDTRHNLAVSSPAKPSPKPEPPVEASAFSPIIFE